MKPKTQKHTTYTYTLTDGVEIEVPHEIEWDTDVHEIRAGDRLIVGYLVRDQYPLNPFEEYDGSGTIVFADSPGGKREIRDHLALDENLEPDVEAYRGDAIAEARRQLGPSAAVAEVSARATLLEYERWLEELEAGHIGTPYVQLLDVYQHSGRHVSLAGTTWYPYQGWDTSRGGALWVPDKDCLDDIESFATSEERAARARELAEQACELSNQYDAGDVWFAVIVEYVPNDDGSGWREDKRDLQGAVFGEEYAVRVLKEELAYYAKEAASHDG